MNSHSFTTCLPLCHLFCQPESFNGGFSTFSEVGWVLGNEQRRGPTSKRRKCQNLEFNTKSTRGHKIPSFWWGFKEGKIERFDQVPRNLFKVSNFWLFSLLPFQPVFVQDPSSFQNTLQATIIFYIFIFFPFGMSKVFCFVFLPFLIIM